MVDLTTTYMGVPIKNPLILGGGPPTSTPEICEKAAKVGGWAAVVLKVNFADDVVQSVCASPESVYRTPRPYLRLVDSRGMERWRPPAPRADAPRSATGKLGKMPAGYMMVSCMQVEPSPTRIHAGTGIFYNGERYLYYINKTKELLEGTDCKVIPDVLAFTEAGWEQQCRLINQSRADMVELNMGAPAAMVTDPRTGRHIHLSSSPEMVERWTRYCVERMKVPVGVNLPAHCTDPLAAVKAAVRGGARGISFGDCPAVKPPVTPLVINPDTLEAGFTPGMPFRSPSGLAWSVSYICGSVAHMRMNGVEADIKGAGGIRDHRDVLRMVMAGASSAQVCTAATVEGVEIGADYLRDLEAWMNAKGYRSLKEIQGRVVDQGLKVDPSRFNGEISQLAGGPVPAQQVALDADRCIDCRWCQSCCYLQAIEMKNGLPVIDDRRCEVCGLCVDVCPVDALSIVARE
ncbi:MAG: 4Fe-4S binding protein [Chloroflexi bacterium]|nr:4Fe-4S binding protein [Chloroflexota bacterium]